VTNSCVALKLFFPCNVALLTLIVLLVHLSPTKNLSPTAFPLRSAFPLNASKSHGVAILSGEPRTVTVTLAGLLRDVILPLNADVFVFCSGTNKTACEWLELALRDSLGVQLRAFDSLEFLKQRWSEGIVKFAYDGMAISYLNMHEAWRIRLGESIKSYQGMQFVMVRFAWEFARNYEKIRGANYFAVMQLRPDILLLNPLPLNDINLRPGGWVHAINDWLVFGRRYAMLSVVLLADTYGTLQLLEGMTPTIISGIIKDKVPLCGEAQLMLRLINDNIRFFPFPSTTAGLVRPESDSRNSLLPTWTESEASSFLHGGARPVGAQFSHEFLIRGWLGPSGPFMYLYEEAPDKLDDSEGPGIVYTSTQSLLIIRNYCCQCLDLL